MGVFSDFGRSFRLDKRFLHCWLFDAIFAAVIAVIFIVLQARSSAINAVMSQPLTGDNAEVVYSLLYSYLGLLLLLALVTLAAYVVLQVLIWRSLTGHIHWRDGLKYALFLLPAGAIILPYTIFVYIAFYFAEQLSIVILGGYSPALLVLLQLLLFSAILPIAIFPHRAFFKSRKVWPAMGRMFSEGFTTLPRLIVPYLLSGAVFTAAIMVFALISSLLGSDINAVLQGLPGVVLFLALIFAPGLAWFRLYVLGLLDMTKTSHK